MEGEEGRLLFVDKNQLLSKLEISTTQVKLSTYLCTGVWMQTSGLDLIWKAKSTIIMETMLSEVKEKTLVVLLDEM